MGPLYKLAEVACIKDDDDNDMCHDDNSDNADDDVVYFWTYNKAVI